MGSGIHLEQGALPQSWVGVIFIGGCQNYGPFLGTLHIRRRIIVEIQKRTRILMTTLLAEVVVLAAEEEEVAAAAALARVGHGG